MEPYHKKFLEKRFFERIMEEDNTAYDDCVLENAKRIIWFGKNAGVDTRNSIEQFPRKAGPQQYWNRKQYFGDHCFVETHTFTYLDKERCHPKLYGTSMEVVACCRLNDDGLITHFEEFADSDFLSKGPRPVPAPQRPPHEVEIYQPNDNIVNVNAGKDLLGEMFDKIMLFEEMSYLFGKKCRTAQMFVDTFFEPTYGELHPNKNGRIKIGGDDRPIYTARRVYSGKGWACECHTVTLSRYPERPQERYRGEIAALCEVDEDEKISLFLEFGHRSSIAKNRVQDNDGRRVMNSKI